MFYVLFVRVIIDADGIIRVFHVIMRFFFKDYNREFRGGDNK